MNHSLIVDEERRLTGARASVLADLGPTLAIDSSLGTSVAVSSGDRLVTCAVDDTLRHAEVVAALIERTLERADVRRDDVSAVVAGIGPGPFTGLRVGIAAAQGFAFGRRVELLPLISHEAVAFSVFDDDPERDEVLVVTDARRKEFFVTRYSRPEPGGFELPILQEAPHLVARADLGEAVDSADPARVDPLRVPASALIELAALRTVSDARFEPPTALYLRSPDVTPSAGPKRVVR